MPRKFRVGTFYMNNSKKGERNKKNNEIEHKNWMLIIAHTMKLLPQMFWRQRSPP